MKRLWTFLCWLGTVLLPWIWLWPFWANPSFSFIDDPVDLKIFRSMSQDFSGWWQIEGFHGEPHNGRIRPVSWLMRYFLYYTFAHENPLLWYVIHYLVLAVILSLFFLFLKQWLKRDLPAFLGCALFVLNPKTMENFTRLSPNENWQVLWLLLLALLFLKCFRSLNQKNGAAKAGIVLVTFLFYFSKETSVVLLPFSVLMAVAALTLKRGRSECLLFMVSNAVFFALQRWLAPPIAGYSSSFSFTWAVIGGNLMRYPGKIQWLFPLLLALAGFSYRVLRRWKTEKRFFLEPVELWQTGGLVLGLGFLAILMPWTQPTPRYIMLPDFLFLFFLVPEMVFGYDRLRQKFADRPAWMKRIVMAAYALLFLIPGFFSQAEFDWDLRYLYGQTGHATPVQDLRNFTKIAKPGAKVLYLEFEKELIRAPILYAHDFFGRPDLQFYSLSALAEKVQKEGYPVKIIPQKDWPKALDEVDYIYWNHRGIKRFFIDRFHAQLLSELLKTTYGPALRLIYSNLYYPLGNAMEGTQIWELDHEVTRKLNLQPNRSLTKE